MNIAYMILFVTLSIVDCEDVDITIRKGVHAKKHFKRVRCTRRYTPGSCLQAVRTVWTYVPHQQSCVERLGCSADNYSNRFNSPKNCNETCRELVYLYMFLQEAEKGNFTIPAHGGIEEDLNPAGHGVHWIYEEYGSLHDGDGEDSGHHGEHKSEHEHYDSPPDQLMVRRYNKAGDRPPVPDAEDVRGRREQTMPDIDHF